MPSPAPGFYGKVPNLGDFVSRRLPPAFIEILDAWSRLLLTSSRAALGDAWLPAWLGAPIWHFGLGPGFLGDDQAWGVLIPSVDRVGRHFPFTIVGPTVPGGRPLRDWALAIESLALAALDDGFSPDTLEQSLADLGPPARRRAGPGPLQQTLPADPGDWPDLVDNTPGPAPGESLWWTRGASAVPPTLLCGPGLPSAEIAACMIGKAKEGQGSALDPLGPEAPDPRY
jgi:type VI secretion system protein ImpM